MLTSFRPGSTWISNRFRWIIHPIGDGVATDDLYLLQQLKVEIDSITLLHLLILFLVQFTLKLLRRQPMGWIGVLQSSRNLAFILPVARMAQMKQIRDHFVLLLSRQGSQFFFNFLDAH